ncbi:BgTH12-03228 [Blumeria graminis f. sp. triticale]|uniref:ethanolamine kinase n=4 Tax=Blumeria graminis TaxID=34373 RepID=A0A656KIZ6_BLUGR|nr:Ethanolamine kinase [Blumeria graminis f. sp. tritici 96224]CAD6503568.1 BgTH12-03228 [Blumeria graminis f. sp. triticale]VDB89709.1 Bgt-1413 [Blumeria graminis f. sp. tritici]
MPVQASLPPVGNIRFIPLSYDPDKSQTSALRLVFALRPEWKGGKIEFIRFTDGITNTLLKVVNNVPGQTDQEIDTQAILLRAYGEGSDIIIDREREAQNHEVLMHHKLAPQLLARFQNGMLYKFLRGTVTSPSDLQTRDVGLAVARRLGEWHAVLPCIPNPVEIISTEAIGDQDAKNRTLATNGIKLEVQDPAHNIVTGNIVPNIWTTMQKWIYALPAETISEKNRQETLRNEMNRLVPELSNRPSLGVNGLVFAHCDLLSGNIIVEPRAEDMVDAPLTVNFIDYEYATPSPAAFDIANHFAEWGGFECDYSKLPTKTQRKEFIRQYISSYATHIKSGISPIDQEFEAGRLLEEVNMFRGIPGFYWGIWGLIQAKISRIDFDYSSYAELRLCEYWDWRSESDGSRAAQGREIPLREARWAEE